MFEVLTNSDGQIYLRLYGQGPNNKSFWGFFPSSSTTPFPKDMIVCFRTYEFEGDDPTDNEMLFSVYKVDNNSIALGHLYNNKFLEQQVVFESTYGLRSIGSSMMGEATRLQLVEPVFRREINVFEFHLDRSRIYDRIPLTLAEGGASNPTNSEQEFTIQFTYNKTKTNSWNSSSSWYVSGSITITSKIPFIGETSIETGGGYSEQYDWGETLSESEEVAASYTVKVPPMTKSTVTAVAMRGTCDVPFSYLQIDHMANGDTVKTTLSDGVFKGMNAYQFDFLVRNQPL